MFCYSLYLLYSSINNGLDKNPAQNSFVIFPGVAFHSLSENSNQKQPYFQVCRDITHNYWKIIGIAAIKAIGKPS
jgi:hypothetical protein